MAQSAIQKCDICQSARGNEYCMDCKQQFCTGCKSSHLRIAVCRNHKFTNSDHALSDSLIFCQGHNDVYVFYCDKCHTPVCKTCVVKAHKGHEMTDIDEIVSKRKASFQNQVELALETDGLKYAENKIAEYEFKVANEVTTAMAALRSDGETVKVYVDNIVKSLLNQIQEQSRRETKDLSNSKSEVSKAIKARDLLRQKVIEFRTVRNDIGLLKEITTLENDLKLNKSPQIQEPNTIMYDNSDLSEDTIRKCFGSVEFIGPSTTVAKEKLVSGKVFEVFLKQGKFRNEISLLKEKLNKAKDSTEQRLILFYQTQLMNKINTVTAPVTITVCVRTSKWWNTIVLECIEVLNTTAPGLFLQTTEDISTADVLILDNKVYQNAIDLSWHQKGSRFVVEIRLGIHYQTSRVTGINVVMFEILCAIGFDNEMTRLYNTLARIPLTYANKHAFILSVDPFSILLNKSNQIVELSSSDFLLRFKLLDAVESHTGLSEFDKVVLNLLFPPCVTKTYQPIVSQETKMVYCGRHVMENHNKPEQSMTDGHCGPDNGPNCPACRTLIDTKFGKMKKLVFKGYFQGWSGHVYCYRNTKEQCGPNYGKPCRSCWKIAREF